MGSTCLSPQNPLFPRWCASLCCAWPPWLKHGFRSPCCHSFINKPLFETKNPTSDEVLFFTRWWAWPKWFDKRFVGNSTRSSDPLTWSGTLSSIFWSLSSMLSNLLCPFFSSEVLRKGSRFVAALTLFSMGTSKKSSRSFSLRSFWHLSEVS